MTSIFSTIRPKQFASTKAAEEFVASLWDRRLDMGRYDDLIDFAHARVMSSQELEGKRNVLLALDLATKTGYSVWNFDTQGIIEHGTWTLPNHTPAARFSALHNRINYYRLNYNVQAIAYEDVYSVGLLHSVANAKVLLGLMAVVDLFCEQNGVQPVPVHPVTARKYAIDFAGLDEKVKKGKDGKAQAKRAALDAFGITVEDDNEADALWVGAYAMQYQQEEVSSEETQ